MGISFLLRKRAYWQSWNKLLGSANAGGSWNAAGSWLGLATASCWESAGSSTLLVGRWLVAAVT